MKEKPNIPIDKTELDNIVKKDFFIKYGMIQYLAN